MMNIEKTDSGNEDFVALVRLLDAELAVRDGDEHAFYDQFNKVAGIKHILLGRVAGEAVACGAIKQYDAETMEVKRMYVSLSHRNRGLASQLLGHLEQWAKELGFKRCILETGYNQPEAIRLYEKCNYTVIPNYGQYEGVANSVCFEKILT